jgi:hypothetical protein
MLILRTGLPGSGKTLNTIREIELEHGPDPKNPAKELRTVYYYGIPDLDLDKLGCNWVEFDTPDEWYNLPDGSVIVMDEAQRVFGAQDGRKARPEKVARFETHRHQGFDIHLITQHPSLIMSHVRKLVGKHINMYRPYGGKRLLRHEYEFCIDSPEKRSQFKLAQERRVKLDAKYFGVYKSATVHTHKFKLPNYVWYIPPLVLFIGAAAVYVTSLYSPKDAPPIADAAVDSVPVAGSDLNAKPTAVSAPGAQQAPLTPEQYAESFSPRISDVPSSAPRYDSLTEPKSFPRLTCVSSFDPLLIDKLYRRGAPVGQTDGRQYACQCYTQQMTRHDTSAEFCMSVVENGYFDDTLPDKLAATQHVFNSDRQQPAAATGRVPAAQMPQPAANYVPAVTVVNSGKPGHLW